MQPGTKHPDKIRIVKDGEQWAVIVPSTYPVPVVAGEVFRFFYWPITIHFVDMLLEEAADLWPSS